MPPCVVFCGRVIDDCAFSIRPSLKVVNHPNDGRENPRSGLSQGGRQTLRYRDPVLSTKKVDISLVVISESRLGIRKVDELEDWMMFWIAPYPGAMMAVIRAQCALACSESSALSRKGAVESNGLLPKDIAMTTGLFRSSGFIAWLWQ
jgi:hypothetical protein